MWRARHRTKVIPHLHGHQLWLHAAHIRARLLPSKNRGVGSFALNRRHRLDNGRLLPGAKSRREYLNPRDHTCRFLGRTLVTGDARSTRTVERPAGVGSRLLVRARFFAHVFKQPCLAVHAPF